MKATVNGRKEALNSLAEQIGFLMMLEKVHSSAGSR
jgi:hypothetical protein